MQDGVIVIAVTESGLNGVKIWHGPGKKSLDKTMDLYRRIAPGMKQLDRLAIKNITPSGQEKINGNPS